MKTTKRKLLQTARAHFAHGWALLALALVLATIATLANAVPRIFNDPTPTDSDVFGTSVALDGNNVLIGAGGDDTLGNGVGQAYLFTIAGGNDLPGDFDLDTDVDGNDLLQWQRGESPNPLSATDYANWQSKFGTVSPAAASVVPEPGAMVLALLVAGASVLRRRRRSVTLLDKR